MRIHVKMKIMVLRTSFNFCDKGNEMLCSNNHGFYYIKCVRKNIVEKNCVVCLDFSFLMKR